MTDIPLPLAKDFPVPTEAQWRALVDKMLRGDDYEKRLVSRTGDGLAIQPLYRRADAANAPGALPAPRPTLGLGWDIRQIHADDDPVAANAAILDDLAGGATSILLHIASPGSFGLPYDGAAIARALDAVLLDACPIALEAGEYTPDAAGSLTALWRERGIAEDQRLGAFNYDPIGTLAATGALYHPVARALEIAASLAVDARQQPGVTALAVNGHVWHKGGATEAQELALVLATLVAYLRACEAKELAPREALGSIAVTLAVDADQMLGLAKFRAARRLIGRVAEACGAADAVAAMALGAETSARMMTKRDPWVNILRTTMATATAAMAGAGSITVLPFTWALGRTDAFARRVARNTHHVLIEEAGLARVGDPAAGSFAIEALTTDLAAKAWALFQDIEANGGIAAGLQSGSIQKDLQTSHAARAKLLAEGRIEMTGASAFPLLGADGITVEPWPGEPLPADLNGARVTPLGVHRLSAPFESLRDRADAHATHTGKAPTIFLATLGDAADFAQRATWTRNFLAAGGIATSERALDQSGFRDTRELGAAFGGSGARVACLCAADATYAALGEAAAAVLKQAGAEHVVVAGRPKDQDAGLRAAGVDAFIAAGCNRIETLAALHAALGVGD